MRAARRSHACSAAWHLSEKDSDDFRDLAQALGTGAHSPNLLPLTLPVTDHSCVSSRDGGLRMWCCSCAAKAHQEGCAGDSGVKELPDPFGNFRGALSEQRVVSMIHCFNAVQKCCSGLCDGCGHACEACGRCSVDLCGGCEQTCKSVPLATITSKPLGCFVIIAAVLNLPAAAFAIASLQNPQLRGCKVSNFCYGTWRLDLSIRSGTEQGARALVQEASQIVLYDFGFCFYVMFFVFSVVYSFLGIGWSSDCPARDSTPIWAAVFVLLFAFWTALFSCCWGLAAGCWGVLETIGISSSFANLFFGSTNPARERPAFAPAVPPAAPVWQTQPQPPGGATASQALYGSEEVAWKKGAQQSVQLQLWTMTSSTSLTAAEVKALYARFRRLAPSGYLLKQQFQQTMGVMGLTDDHFLADRMFEVFDSNQDGRLSFEEFASALAIMIRGSEDEKLKLSFNMVAGREAKGLRLEDFQHLVASCNHMMSSLVAPTGRLTTDEDVKRLFHDLASESEGEEVISLDAYKAAAQENAEFLACLGIDFGMQCLEQVAPSRAPFKPSHKKVKQAIKEESVEKDGQDEVEWAQEPVRQAYAGWEGDGADRTKQEEEFAYANPEDQPAYAGWEGEGAEQIKQEEELEYGNPADQPAYTSWEDEGADQTRQEEEFEYGNPADQPAYACWADEGADQQEQEDTPGFANPEDQPAYAGWEDEGADQQEQEDEPGNGYANPEGQPAYAGWEDEGADHQEQQEEFGYANPGDQPACAGWEVEGADQQEQEDPGYANPEGQPAYAGWEDEGADQQEQADPGYANPEGQPAYAGWEDEGADQQEQAEHGYANPEGQPAYAGWEDEGADQQEQEDTPGFANPEDQPACAGWEDEGADQQEQEDTPGFANPEDQAACAGWEDEGADQQEQADPEYANPEDQPACAGWEGEGADQQEQADPGYANPEGQPAYAGWEGEGADQQEQQEESGNGYANSEGQPTYAGWEGEGADKTKHQEWKYVRYGEQSAYAEWYGADPTQRQEEWKYAGWEDDVPLQATQTLNGWGYSRQGYQIKRDGSEARLMLTMPGFAKWHISRMIGRRGSNLLEIARASGCKVHLCGRDSNRPTDEPNYLKISGNQADVETALQIACEKVKDVLETDIPICDYCGEDHKSRDCPTASLPFVHQIFLAEGTKVGFIIGSGGRNVAPIKEATGALIRMCGIGSGQLHACEPLHMRIECKTREELDVAVDMASKLIDRVVSWSPYDSLPPKDHVFAYQRKIILDMEKFPEDFDSLNAHLLGQGGSNFRCIHDLTGAWLWLRGEGSGGATGSPNAEEPLHILIEHDTQAKLEKAVAMVEELIAGVEALLEDTVCKVCGGPHFTYRCSKANSAGYLKEMRSKGTGKGGPDMPSQDDQNFASQEEPIGGRSVPRKHRTSVISTAPAPPADCASIPRGHVEELQRRIASLQKLEPCPFEVLGIKDFDAPASAIESAFRKRSLDCHPDKKPGDPTAKAQFEALAAAKETLLDPVRRAAAQSAASTSCKAPKGPFTRFAQCRAAVRKKTGATPAKPQAATVQPPRAEEKPPAPGIDPEKVAAGIFFRHLEREREKKEGPREYLLPRVRFSRSTEEAPHLKTAAETRRVLKPGRHSGVKDGAGVFGKVKNISEMSEVPRARNVQTHRTNPFEKDRGEGATTEGFAFERQAPRNPRRLDLEHDDHPDLDDLEERDTKDTGDPCPLPLLLPWTDHVTLVSAIVEVTGAKKPDAGILARVVEILRERGGQAPLAVLTRNPMRLQSVLSRHARLLEVYLPGKYLAGTGLQVHVRLRGAEFQRAAERFKQNRAAQAQAKAKAAEMHGKAKARNSGQVHGTALPRRTKVTVRVKPGRPGRRRQQVCETVDVDSSDESCCEVASTKRKRPRTEATSKAKGGHGGRAAHQAGTEEPLSGIPPDIDVEVLPEDRTARPDGHQDSGASKALDQENDRLLHRAYAHAASRPGKGQLRYFLLLPAGNLGALRPQPSAILFSFDPASKVLYEYVPGHAAGQGRCVVMWSPHCPEVNALLWTVLPLPPDPSSEDAPGTPPGTPPAEVQEEDEVDEVSSEGNEGKDEELDSSMQLIDALIRDAAAEAGALAAEKRRTMEMPPTFSVVGGPPSPVPEEPDIQHGAEAWPPHDGDLDVVSSFGSQSAYNPADPLIQDPPHDPHFTADESPVIWRCLRCSSDDWYGSEDHWFCSRCNSTEFYQVTHSTKKVTPEGTWLYLPHHQQGPVQSRRRRRRRGQGPSSSADGWSERGEEETGTFDPTVDPDAPRSTVRRPSVSAPQTPVQAALVADSKRDNSRSESSVWDVRKGPDKGVRWKSGAPPTPPTWKYDPADLRAYSKYTKKVRIWELQMAPYASKPDQALMLYNSLTGEAEQELEHVSIEDLYTDSGIETILNMLKSPMEQKMIYQKRKFLHEFENMRRYAGENMRAFINRFRRSQRNLKSVGIDISGTYDIESLGARLLDRSGLTAEQQRMILVGTQQSLRFEAVSEAMTLQFPDFRGPPPIAGQGNGKEGKSKGPSKSSQSMLSTASTVSGSSSGKGYGAPRKAWIAETADDQHQEDEDHDLPPIEEAAHEPNDDDDQQPADDNDVDDDPTSDLADLAEVLTVTAKKLSGLTLARGWSKPKTGNPKDKSRSVEDTKKVTHCTACGARGHWYQDPECPMNNCKKFNKPATTSQGSSPSPSTSYNMPKNDKGKGKQHAVRFIHHDHGTMDITEAPEEYGTAFNTLVVSQVLAVPYQINEIKISGAEQFAGYLVTDSGCQRTCCGQKWFDSHVSKLQSFGMAPHCIAANDLFQFGKGQPSTSTTRAYLPTGIDGFSMILGTSLLGENIPLLGSNSLMTRLGAILDFGADWITFEAIGVHAKVHRIAGHLAVNILDFHDQNVSSNPVWQELANDDNWHDPDPELLLSSAQPQLQHVPRSTTMVGSMEACGNGSHCIP
eukprot:s209_g32.t3